MYKCNAFVTYLRVPDSHYGDSTPAEEPRSVTLHVRTEDGVGPSVFMNPTPLEHNLPVFLVTSPARDCCHLIQRLINCEGGGLLAWWKLFKGF